MAVAPSTTHPLRGILAMVAGTALFACGDVFAKMLTPELPPLMIAWMRYVVFAVLFWAFCSRPEACRASLRGAPVCRSSAGWACSALRSSS